MMRTPVSTVFLSSWLLSCPWYIVHSAVRASQVVLVVKNLPANAGHTRDTVQSLGQEDPMEKEMATRSSILAWRIPMDRGAWRVTVPWGHERLGYH